MNIELIHGDCLEKMRDIPDGSVDMILCDIPYGVVNRSSGGLRNLNKGLADIVAFDVIKCVSDCVRICNGSFYIFCATEQVSLLRSEFVRHNLTTRLCVWEKTNPSPMNGKFFWLSSIECCVFARKPKSIFNEHCASSVWRNPTAKGKIHPTMKPVSLMERLIKASSNNGQTVLDFTMGSGTTGIACINTNRNFIGIEMDKTYFDIASKRINDHKATLCQNQLKD